MLANNKKRFGMLSLVFTLVLAMFNFTSIGTAKALPAVTGVYFNDADQSIHYSAGWGYSSNRGVGDYDNDLHYTTANGEFVEFTFTGTGIEVVAPTNDDPGYGKFDVFIDGGLQGSGEAGIGNSNYAAAQIVYGNKNLSAGQHTIKLVKSGGSYLQLDAFITYDGGTLTDQELADLAQAAIDALPDQASITIADKQAVQAAEKLYNFLTDAQKALVGDISRLTNARLAIKTLEALPVSTDKITYLMADRAERPGSLGMFVDPGHLNEKRFWVTNWNSPSDYFRWTVNVPVAGEYLVDALVKSPKDSVITVAGVNNGSVQLAGSGDWDKIRATGTLSLPAGVSDILVTADHPNHNEFRSLELIPAAEWPAMEQRIADFRSDTRWFRDARYGVFFQWGEWGYPQSGDKKPWPQQINDFDVNAFADQMAKMGAGYVIWSATWWSYYFPAPIKAVDDILPGHTSQRDLIGELADALNKKGIKLMLYYHTGSETKDWWDTNWVSMDDKTKFLTNWKNIMTEVGNRYGTKLAGWYIDDEAIYYPADFEELGAAAKAGNPERIITYNNYVGARGTDFQDYVSYEWYMPLPNNENGIMKDGRYKGLQAHTAFITENDWGVHLPNQPIVPSLSADEAVSRIVQSMQHNQVLSYNLMMYEDGTMNPSSVQMMIYVKNAAKYGIIGTDDPRDRLDTYNDSDPRITYTGSWNASGNRDGDTYRSDVHYTKTDGDSAEFAFKGTGIQFITETDANQGNIEVFVDGISEGIFDSASSSRKTNQVVFAKQGLSPNEPHSIKLVKVDGEYMLVDAFKIVAGGASSVKPVVADHTFMTTVSKDILGQLQLADDVDGMLTFRLLHNGEKGTAVIDYRTGKFSYTPNAGASGTDAFTYVVDNGSEVSDVGTVTVQFVEPVGAVASQPADQAVEVAYDLAAAKITFNQPVRQGPDFSLISLTEDAKSVQASVSVEDRTLSVSPVGGFQPSKTYEINIPVAAITGESGDHPAGDYRLSFKTASKSVTPANPDPDSNGPSIPTPTPTPTPMPTPTPDSKPIPKLTPIPGFAAEFADINAHWAKKDIELLASLSVLKGKTNTKFAPNESITRAEFTALLVRILGLTPEQASPAFSDVTAKDWYADAIAAAVEAGLVNGFEDGSFRPADAITREQMAVMIVRFMKAAGQDGIAEPSAGQNLEKYKDRQAASAWAKEDLAICVGAGIIQSAPDLKLVPGADATRAEAAAMVVRMLQYSQMIS